MSEKEYKALINSLEIDETEKNILDEKFNLIEKIITNNISPLFTLKDFKESGNTLKKTNNKKDLRVECLLNFQSNALPVKNFIALTLNEIENIIYLNKEGVSFEDFSRDLTNAVASFKDADVEYLLQLRFDQTSSFNFANEINKLDLFKEYSSKYSLFINTLKFLLYYLKKENITVVSSELLEFLLMYGLDQYNTANKYSNYLESFLKALDDLLSNYHLEFGKEKTITKSFYAISPITKENVAGNINALNAKELRQLRKTLNFLIEEDIPTVINTPFITIDVTPSYNKKQNTYSWSFELLGHNIKNSGGAYPNSPLDIKTATLKALFKALKTITDNPNIQTKNINIKGASNNTLKCIEKSTEEYENNSRRKTITSLIEDNNLKISFIS